MIPRYRCHTYQDFPVVTMLDQFRQRFPTSFTVIEYDTPYSAQFMYPGLKDVTMRIELDK